MFFPKTNWATLATCVITGALHLVALRAAAAPRSLAAEALDRARKNTV